MDRLDFQIADITSVFQVHSGRSGVVRLSPAQQAVGVLIETRRHEFVLVWDGQDPRMRMSIEREVRLAGMEIARRMTATPEVIRCIYDQESRSTVVTLTEEMKGEPQILVEKIIQHALEIGASDIHMRAEGTHTDVSFRVNGDIVPYPVQLTRTHGEQMAITLWNMKDQTSATDEFRRGHHQQCRIERDVRVELEGEDSPETLSTQLRYQGSPMKAGAFKLVMRLLGRTSDTRTLQECGYSTEQCAALEMVATASDGLVLVSGPVNSGKSVTLSAMGTYQVAVYGNRKVIATVEDPIELNIPGACQHPVVGNAADAFDEAVRAVLRQDVNTIILGEIRTDATADICRRAAETGHLVMSSIHATNAWTTLTRINKLGIELDKLGDPGFLRGICNQRLLPMVCQMCSVSGEEKAKNPIFALQIDRIRKTVEKDLPFERLRFKTHKGCPNCNGGTTGLKLVAEILLPDETFCEFLEAGDLKKAREYWTSGDLSLRNGLPPGNAFSSAYTLMAAGLACPFDVEHRFGQLHVPKTHERRHLAVVR